MPHILHLTEQIPHNHFADLFSEKPMLSRPAARPHEQSVITKVVSLKQAVVLRKSWGRLKNQWNMTPTLRTKWHKTVILAEIRKNFWSYICLAISQILTVQAFETILCSSPMLQYSDSEVLKHNSQVNQSRRDVNPKFYWSQGLKELTLVLPKFGNLNQNLKR